MSDKYFADTNVLAYAFDQDEPGKRARAHELLETEGVRGNLVISTQVLQEFFVVVTRKLSRPVSAQDAEQAVHAFSQYPMVLTDPQLVFQAIRRHRTASVSFWDGLIIQAALAYQCTVLLTEDLQHGQSYDSLVIRNPFRR